ncbi:group 3 secretory phospholipase A2 [Xyrauchen texanus]|uniref:group 3 secretory phospholipase A2 n=1 Tax=Xyrauchen texanus TaxID=154827 RepID=UPI0022425DD9|nr:group 3 secretory phospholipase A2 [Xyrauchen texanus]
MNRHFHVVLCLLVLSLDCFGAGIFKTSENSTFCIWTRSISDGRTHYTFLRRTQKGRKTSLLLYDSIWNKYNSLVTCLTSNAHSVIESYLSKCLDSGGSSFSETPDVRFNISELVEPGGPCEAADITEGLTASVRRARDLQGVDLEGSVHQDSGDNSRLKLQRSKRAWMIPGTMWCGSGNRATDFSELGVFQETDNCCRDHDHCKDTIASFSYNHGIFNTNIFTLSHCDCDNRFRRCLLGVNTTVSNLVGYGYFNLLKMRCFEFSQRMQCARRTWWGMCAFSELAPYAVVKGPSNYTDTLSKTNEDTLRISFQNTITLGENQATTNSEASLTIQAKDFRDASKELSIVPTSPWPSVTTRLFRKTEPPVAPTDPPKPTLPEPKRKGTFEMCDSYRDLDSCHLQIPGQQVKFGLLNPDLRTLYHCNCTARLARKISELDEDDSVHSLLMDFVSQSCFTLPQSENCTEGNGCSTPSKGAPLIQHWRKDMMEEGHLVDHRRKLKRMNSKRSKRKDFSVRLFRKCIRMHAKLQRTRVPEQKRS